MPQSETESHFTPEDLLALPDAVRYELVDGQLVERKMGFQSSVVGGRLFRHLDTYCDQNSLGWVAPADAGYQCFPDAPNKVRKPDVSFIAASRLPFDQAPSGHCRIAPDFAAEVISPNEIFDEAIQKVGEYLDAVVRLVWIIDPPSRTVLIFRPDGGGTIVRGAGELSGEDVIPGFRCSLHELLRPPHGTEAS
ncbi:MAG: Uma2 family endonuclease [Planctomycetes bacterium]|nr:Uma2 family endonuclease [Planctomycetota bacterium]